MVYQAAYASHPAILFFMPEPIIFCQWLGITRKGFEIGFPIVTGPVKAWKCLDNRLQLFRSLFTMRIMVEGFLGACDACEW